MSFHVELTYDTHDCETCGYSSADGYRIYQDGELVIERVPVAHCFNSTSYDHADALIEIINGLGEHVTVEYEQENEDEDCV